MQKSAFLLVITAWLALSCLAQEGEGGFQKPGPGGGNMLESTHIGYLTQRLNLSPEEAQRSGRSIIRMSSSQDSQPDE